MNKDVKAPLGIKTSVTPIKSGGQTPVGKNEATYGGALLNG